MNTKAVIEVEGLAKTYGNADLEVNVLADINLTVEEGARVAIVGASGSGKSTLLHLIGGLDLPTSGRVRVCGYNVSNISDNQRADLRNEHVGFVYQFHHLLPEFSALENVGMPLLQRGWSIKKIKSTARNILQKVGLEDRTRHKPSELSGGERQRVAIARALVTRPSVVLADEPTGNLDHKTAQQVADLMFELNSQLGTAIVMVTHDVELAKKMDRGLTLIDGKIEQSW